MERIIEQGGSVLMLSGTWRVNGLLAVSRAIGDAKYKPHVTGVPEIKTIPLDGNEDFLILACDGLWDFMSEQEAAEIVYNSLLEDSGEYSFMYNWLHIFRGLNFEKITKKNYSSS